MLDHVSRHILQAEMWDDMQCYIMESMGFGPSVGGAVKFLDSLYGVTNQGGQLYVFLLSELLFKLN